MEKYKPVSYPDFLLRIILCAIGAHWITNYDESDSFFEAIFTSSYLRGFGVSFIAGFLAFSLIRWISILLDKRFHWKADTILRLIFQLIFGLLVPMTLIAGIMAGYFAYFGVFDLYPTYIQQDFIVAIMMLIVVNLFYFGMSLYYQVDVSKLQIKNDVPMYGSSTKEGTVRVPLSIPQEDNAKGILNDSRINDERPILETNGDGDNRYLEIIIVNTPKKSIPIKVADIAYFFILNDTVFIRTKGMDSINDAFQYPAKLKMLESQLDPHQFFRINRKIIVSVDACAHYTATKSKTLLLTITPPPYSDGTAVPREHHRLCIVSEYKVSAFKAWIMRTGMQAE